MKFGLKTALIATVLTTMVGNFAPVSAQVISLQQLRVDESIVIKDLAFSVPTQILVVPLFPPESSAGMTDREWFRGLFYYSIANERRPGFTDVPFHYVVSHTGEIFKGNSGGEERKINISGVGDDVVVVGYLAGKSDNAFDPRAQSSLTNLILDISNRNSILGDKVAVGSVKYVRDDESQTITITKADVFGLWKTSLASIMETVKRQYSPVPKTYKVEVVGFDVPAAEVNPGDIVTGKITIKNTGEYGIYPGTTSELVGTKKAGASLFYAVDGWAGISQFSLTSGDPVILPGQEKAFEFKLRAPLYFGAQTEAYGLTNVSGQAIAGTDFNVTLNIKKPEGVTIVEIKETETGWLRVRATPSGAATELTRVSAGERYYQTGDEGNGWVKIKLNDGREGWVSKQFLFYP